MELVLLNKIFIISINVMGVWLAFWVYFANQKVKINQIFFWLTLIAIFWIDCAYFSNLSTQDNYVKLWAKIGYSSVPVWIVLFYYFTKFFIKEEKKFSLSYKLIIIICASLFLFCLFTDMLVEGVKFTEWGAFPVLGKGKFIYFGIIFFLALFIFSRLTAKYFKDSREEKIKTQYFLFGLFIFIIMNFIFNAILPIWQGAPQYYHFGNYSVFFLLGFTAYAIVKRELFGIRVVLTSFLVGTIGLVLLMRIFTSPDLGWRIFDSIIFALFCLFGYLLIKAINTEIERRKKIESLSEELKISNIRLNTALRDLKRSYKKLKRLDEAKTQFLSIASHQLRTPLSVIKGYLSMVLSGEYGSIDKKPKRFLNNVYKSTERLIGLVSDFLNISRLQMGEMKFNFEKLQLEEIVRSVVNEFSHTAKEKELYLIFKKPNKEMPEIQVDRQKIRQVVLNLIDNAIKYTKEGGVTVEVKNLKNKCQLIVEDTGIGMNKDELDRTFKMFERGMEAVLTCPDGSGVGLFVARQIVKAHNGKLRVESKGRGMGSKFIVELPIVHE